VSGGQDVYSVAFSPEGNESYTTSDDGSVYAWGTVSGQLLHPMGPPSEGTIKDLAFAPVPLMQFAVALDNDIITVYNMGGPSGSGGAPSGPGGRTPTPGR